MRVSSVAKYAFASHVDGCLPIVTEGVRSSACSRVNAAFRPGRAGRFVGTNTARPSTAGYSARTVPRFASAPPVRRGLVSDLLPRDESMRRIGTVKDRVRQRGNSGRPPYVSEWHECVGVIPALTHGGFSSNFRKGGQSPYFRHHRVGQELAESTPAETATAVGSLVEAASRVVETGNPAPSERGSASRAG